MNTTNTNNKNKTFGSIYAEEKAMLKALLKLGYKIHKTKRKYQQY